MTALFHRIALALCLAVLPAQAAFAGVAVVQAVEQGGGVCKADSAAAAFECAKKQCVESSGALMEDCLEMSYCEMGFTVDVFMQANEGNHWHEFYCGWNDRKTAIAAGKLACNPDRKKDLMECAPVQLIDGDGVTSEITEDELK